MRIRQPAALLAAIIIVFCSVFSAQYTFASENERIYIVYAGSGMDSEAAAELFEKACGKKPLYVYSYALKGFSASMSDTDLKRILSLGMFGEIREASVHTSSKAVECPALLSDSLVKYSTETIGAKEAHDSGYRGAGTVAAVIDCGFDTSHEYFVPSSQVKNILTKEKVASAKLNSSEAVLEYGLDTYLSVKIPYAFNYYDRSVTFLSESSHGTHVAGIIGGSGGTSDGVAPDAQLILMNVGDSKGEKIADYLIFAAFEDALALGADVINLSLGMTAGFSEAEPSEARGYLRLLEKAEELGTEVFCAAGNSGMLGKDSLYDMLYEIAYPKASAPDYGVISAPASFDGAVAVASSDNSVVCLNGYLRYGENYITNYTKPASSDFFSSLNGDYEYVLIHGDGSDKCYAGIDVSGKIALIERGGITFEEKLRSAERAGAAGAIIFDNLTDGNLITMEDGGCSVPSLFVSRSDGLLLASAAGGTVSVIHDTIAVPTDNPDGISSFSSHGATPELKLKPDLTAPGGYIYSSADGGGYKYMSGTSMASPHAAAAYMLTEKNLNSRGLSRDLALPLLMSSAHLIYDRESGVPVSPRAQGAGLVNVNSALNSELIMYAASENGDKAAKIELSDGTSGRLEFDIVIENIGTRQLGVRLSASIQSDGAFFSDSACDYFVAEHPEAFTGAKVYAAGIEKNININSEDFKKGSYVRIFPGEAKTVRICVILDSGEIEKKLEIFKNGFFTEGFVIAETSDGMQTASIPYMGFYGSWGELDAIDTSFYECGLTAYDDTSENGVVLFGSGDNAAFSPGKDGRFDSIGINLNLTRSVRSLSIDISDSEGNTVYQGKNYYNVKKAYAEDGVLVPSVASYVWDGSDGINSRFKYDDGQYYVNVRLTPAFTGAPTQTFSFCITVDTEAPEAVVSYVNRKITLSAHDGHLISSVRVYAPGAGDLGKVSYNSETASGDVVFSCDIPDGFSGKFVYAEVTDFAANKKVVILRLDKAERSR